MGLLYLAWEQPLVVNTFSILQNKSVSNLYADSHSATQKVLTPWNFFRSFRVTTRNFKTFYCDFCCRPSQTGALIWSGKNMRSSKYFRNKNRKITNHKLQYLVLGLYDKLIWNKDLFTNENMETVVCICFQTIVLSIVMC